MSVMEAKDVVLDTEGDEWFFRNKEQCREKKVSESINKFSKWLDKNSHIEKNNVLEVGASYGYNINYLSQKYGMNGYGVEPSLKAVEYGHEVFPKINLIRGTADELNFEDESFDIVILGFFLYSLDRKYLLKVIAEADRVLKPNGLLVLNDFDTKNSFKRKNIHSDYVPTFKHSISKIIESDPQYFLAFKDVFGGPEGSFPIDIQDRYALSVFYKESIENSYING